MTSIAGSRANATGSTPVRASSATTARRSRRSRRGCNSSTAACRAPISWTPASGPPAKTCATLSGTCSNAGQSCGSPADCCNGAACVDFKCAAPATFEAADFTRDYVAECPDSHQPRWQLLSYYLTTEGDSKLQFKVQTASTLAGLATLPMQEVSAAIAELAVTAKTAAASTSFFMTIPISILEQPGFVAPRNRKTDCDQSSRLIWSVPCDQ